MLKHPLCSTSCPWVAQGNGAIHNCISFTPSWSPSAPAPWAPPCGCMWRPALHSGRGLHRDRLVLYGPLLETSFWCLERSTSCPAALTLASAGLFLSDFSLLSPICCHAAVFLSLICSPWDTLLKLELAQNWHRAMLDFAHTGHFCSIPTTENLPCKPNKDRK